MPATARWLGFAALLVGSIGAIAYHHADLALTHYDAKAHLVVARRILDSINPGWRQIGAVWLPLPHVLNALPVQVDAWYRTGASATVLSIAAFAAATSALGWLVLRATGSRAGAIVGAALFALNPNVLYLQATPMTEPLLLGFALLAASATYGWLERGAAGWPTAAGLAIGAACLTRYEAWPIAAASVAIVALARARAAGAWAAGLASALRLAVYPIVAVAAFLAHSRVTIGQWLVTEGFFTTDNPALGKPLIVTAQIVGGLQILTGHAVLWPATVAALVLVVIALRAAPRTSLLLLLGTAAAAALPAYAFYVGHPFRVRYMVPLIAAAAASIGAGVGLLPRGRIAAGVLLAGLAVVENPPGHSTAPMLQEAQWDRPNIAARQIVTEYLSTNRDGEKILVSMGSLAHYMQETAAAGFRIRDYVHEGNGQIWDAALAAPARHVGWILIRETDREGRDVPAARARSDPGFLRGFARVQQGGDVTLYRRVEHASR